MADFIERKIVLGAIVSTDYISTIEKIYKPRYIQAAAAKTILSWCFTYFRKYGKAPGKDIQSIYFHKLRAGLDKKRAQLIETILEGLSEESIDQEINFQYLVDQTKQYFKKRALLVLAEDIQAEVDSDNVEEAESIALSFDANVETGETVIDVFSKEVGRVLKSAFEEKQQTLIRFPKALGRFWNQELVRGGFVALMGHEKIGKTWLLIELAMRALKTGSKVAFFQAGDMTEKQQMRRLAVYLCKRSDQERYCKEQWLPKVDCWYNQTDECNRDEREENIDRIFKKKKEITFENLVKAALEYPEHVPCRNCSNISGAVWLERIKPQQPLTWKEAFKAFRALRKKYNRKFIISTHPNEALSVSNIKTILSNWERSNFFTPDVVIIDYADILVPCPDLAKYQFRHQESKKWQRLRRLSEEKHCLVITATQAAATSYDKPLLDLGDFSEDKRKLAHVTALYGLNQLPHEKQIGQLRINELVVRESDFNRKRPITILQRLQIGRPFLSSYF